MKFCKHALIVSIGILLLLACGCGTGSKAATATVEIESTPIPAYTLDSSKMHFSVTTSQPVKPIVVGDGSNGGSDSFDPDDISLQSVDSSCFSKVGYDASSETLVVMFRDSGKKYAYSNFPVEEWSKFISADSLGTYFNQYIKGNYDCEKLS